MFCEHHVYIPESEQMSGKSSYCQSCADGTLHCSLFIPKYAASPEGKRAKCACGGSHVRVTESGKFCEDCGVEKPA